MNNRIEYYGKSGQNLKYSVCKPDGTPKGAPLHPLPESQTSGYYTTISHIDLEKGDKVVDKVVIYGPENVLWEGDILTWEGDFVTVDEMVGKGEFSAEAQALAIFRIITYLIYILICLFAALITISEWGPIKAFIGKILWPK
jgi:hypothetical protein